MEAAAFYLLAFLAVAGALFMVLRRNPLDGALALVMTLCALAGLFAMLQAEFVFILQILVYAGAIMVLIIFTIMLLNLSKEELQEPPVGRVRVAVVVLTAAGGAVLFLKAIALLPDRRTFMPGSFGSIEKVGELLLSTYMYPFEVISAVLVVAIVGVVILAKKVI